MWAENDFNLPRGAQRLELGAPQSGNRYVMYHGTSAQDAHSIMRHGFSPSGDGMLGRGVYMSRDLQKASRYPLDLPERERVVIKAVVDVGSVKKIDHQDHPMRKTWHAHGYDTAWVPPNCGMVPSGLEEDCVWEPQSIRAVDAIRPQVAAAKPPRTTRKSGTNPRGWR